MLDEAGGGELLGELEEEEELLDGLDGDELDGLDDLVERLGEPNNELLGVLEDTLLLAGEGELFNENAERTDANEKVDDERVAEDGDLENADEAAELFNDEDMVAESGKTENAAAEAPIERDANNSEDVTFPNGAVNVDAGVDSIGSFSAA